MPAIPERIDAIDWRNAEESLSTRGYAVTSSILTPEECAEITALYNDDSRFRSLVIMERYRFGVGDYKYFANPLPAIVASLRTNTYPHLAKVANAWAKAFGETKAAYPTNLGTFLALCHKAAQTKPTPLVLHYEAGGYNCLHQDLYGEITFPLQIFSLLAHPAPTCAGRAFL